MGELKPWLAAAGVLGALLSLLLLRPILPEIVKERVWWAQMGAAAAALILLPPVILVLFNQTRHFRIRGLTEVGSAAFQDPPMPEAAAQAIRRILRPGETWATVTRLGHCADIHVAAFYWLAFRLVPNQPDCVNADVELYLWMSPPPGARIVDRGKDFWVVRR